jgi:hypothetical protein
MYFPKKKRFLSSSFPKISLIFFVKKELGKRYKYASKN